MNRSKKVILAALVATTALVSGACKSPGEVRPAFTDENPLPQGALSGTIAVTTQRDGRYFVESLDASTGKKERITPPGVQERSPAWSPDGSQLAVAGVGGTPGIFLESGTGTNRRALISGPGYFDSPTWSPDGKQIAYAHAQGSTSMWQLFVINVDGTGAQPLTDGDEQAWAPDWSPDGDQIAFTSDKGGSNAVWLIDVDDKSTKKISGTAEGQAIQPRWSPDGKTVIFTSNRTLKKWQLYSYDEASGEVKQALRTTGVDRSPTWSPDGKFILVSVAYLAVYDANGDTLPGGGDRWRVTRTLAYSSSWKGN